MTQWLVLFAQLDGLNPLNSTAPSDRSAGLVFKDLLVIIATGLALGLLLLFWARHYVKSKKRHDRHRKTASPSLAGADEHDHQEEPHHGRRRRKRRRDHRPRNPTLAETGGLPTTKTEPSSNPPL